MGFDYPISTVRLFVLISMFPAVPKKFKFLPIWNFAKSCALVNLSNTSKGKKQSTQYEVNTW